MRLILASDSGSFGGKYTRALPVGPNGFHASQSEEAQPVPKVVTWGRMLLSNSYRENCGLVNSWRLKSCLLLPQFEGILGCLLCNICQHQIIALKNCFSLFNRKYLQIFAYVPLCQWLQKIDIVTSYLFQASGFEIIFCTIIFQAGPVVESILRSFPDYIKVKDLPHDDITYKVNHLHFLSLRCSLIAYLNAVVFRWRLNFAVTVPCFAYFISSDWPGHVALREGHPRQKVKTIQ